ncbi:hypothetical protein F511_23148 [Dorcoceras hygrometricum]|uniref:Uncharacterized protein n=1 Tax=Dorcoceras hygrometricum TaxID=472368 RepID=A0A2Z7C1Q8_9LAMI|nr:hypothetical protein F511_23148 [Dorcoceras hygrometricum]
MGIDQLDFQSVHLNYLKILQVSNADPNNTKAGKEYECINRGNHPVIIRPVSHHSSVVLRNNQSVGHHSDDSVEPFRQDTSVCHNVALTQILLRHGNSSIHNQLPPLVTSNTAGTSLELKSRSSHGQEIALLSCRENTQLPASSCFSYNINSIHLTGINRKSHSGRAQRHQSRSKQWRKSTAIYRRRCNVYWCRLFPLRRNVEFVGKAVADPDSTSRGAAEEQKFARKVFNTLIQINKPFIGGSLIVTLLASRRLAPTSFARKPALQTVGDGRPSNPVHDRKQSSSNQDTASRWPTTIVAPKSQFRTCPTDHGKALATSPHDPLGITDSACKNQSVVVSVQYGPFNTYIPIRSTTIGKSRVAKDPIAMHTSWRSNSDIASVTSIGYPRMRASGESSTTKHRLIHASGSHPIPSPSDPK